MNFVKVLIPSAVGGDYPPLGCGRQPALVPYKSIFACSKINLIKAPVYFSRFGLFEYLRNSFFGEPFA
jgi:hypothetical protein